MQKKLLKRMLELSNLSPNFSEWSLINFEDNWPRYYRLQMIDALFKALNITVSYEDFFDGKFLNDTTLPDKQVILSMLASLEISDLSLKESDTWEIQHARHSFTYLMRYRMYLYQIQNIEDGVYAASGFYRLPSIVFSKMNSSILHNSKVIDSLLELFINPSKLKLTKKELIAQFNFPKVDLLDIDMDYL